MNIVDDNPMTRPTKGDSLWDLLQSPLLNQNALPRYHFTQDGYDPPRTTTELAYHVLTGGDLDSYIKRRVANPEKRNPQLQRLMGASDKAPTRCAKLQLFGEYLHAFEDTFAHRDKDNNPYSALQLGLGVGHGLAGGENPDYTYNHFALVPGFGYWGENYDRTIEMEKEVFEKMRKFSKPGAFRLSWKTIEYTMEQFTKFEANAKSENLNDKIVILNDALKRFEINVNLLSETEAFNKKRAGENREKFLATLKPEDYVGTILPQGMAPLQKP